MSWFSLRADLPPMENAGPILMVVLGILITIAIITTSARIYARIRNRIFGWDDAMMLIAVAFSIARLAVEIKQSQYGNGKHRVYLTARQYMMINMYGWYGQIFLFTSVAFLKVSIGFLILRIKDTKAFKILVYSLMAGVVFTNGGVVIILLAECRPAGFWRGSSAKCWPSHVRIYSIYATIAFSVTTDLVLSIIPLFIVWKVRMPLKTKVSVCCLMSLGLVATGFGIARAASLKGPTTDLSWTYCIAAIWSNLELFLGIIAANLAIARSTYSYIFGRRTASQSDSHYKVGSPSASAGEIFLSQKLRADRCDERATTVDSKNINRRPSVPRSDHSDVGLVPDNGIQMKMEFWLKEEEIEMQRQHR
ncbi:uncharacterized protein PAC_01450 [Phialocephala subalpina]|uniref:Rhodopsin domain-containing protein n=1 Tax=Phialocephala subalpina TaxID=576137 RepID=A0A1L7WFM7_9HELO|nr:uncharacterized protein PAC_01450 [Phialocephala subalpina]